MRSWRLESGATSLENLKLVTLDPPSLRPGEVLIRVRACSLNYRDQIIPKGQYMGGTFPEEITPLSDGAGEVVAIGGGVTRFAVGDRVAGTFFQNWADGPPRGASAR